MKRTMKFSAVFASLLVMCVSACNKVGPGTPEIPDEPVYSIIVGNCENLPAKEGLGMGKEAVLGGATKLSAEQLSQDGSNVIEAIRMHITAESSDCKVFVRETLEGENLAEATFEYNPYGWSYARFDTPFEIPQGKELYVGYELTSSEFPLGFNGRVKSEDMVCVDGQWSQLSSVVSGFLTIQAVLGGGEYEEVEPKYDLAFSSISSPITVLAGSTNELIAYISNKGFAQANSVKIEGTYNGTPFSVERKGACIPVGGYAKISLGAFTAPSSRGVVEIKASVSNIDFQDASDKDNSIVAKQNVEVGGYERNMVLIDYFTGQSCVNCPSGAQALSKAIAGMDDPEKVCWIMHHAGYYPDTFTLDEDKSIASFFNVGAAPMSIINRSAQLFEGTPTLVAHPATITTKMLEEILATQTSASIDMTHTYNASTRELEVTVSGNTANDALRLTVLIMQSGISAQQAGTSGGYEHNFVPRAYLTPAMGDKIDAVSGKYSKTYSFTVPQKVGAYDVVDADVEVVAIVAADGKSSSDSPAFNAVKKPLTGGASKAVEYSASTVTGVLRPFSAYGTDNM